MTLSPYWVDGRVVGNISDDGVFVQNITSRHIYNSLQAKGMDLWLHRGLIGKCELWRLVFKDTGQVLSIPFSMIESSGKKHDPGGGVGVQIFVPLALFEEEKPAIQMRLL